MCIDSGWAVIIGFGVSNVKL